MRWGERFQGTSILARFILRRERVGLAAWLIGIVGITLAVALSFPSLYPSALERQAIAETMRNPAMIAMLGPAFGIDEYTFGPMLAHQMLLFSALAVAVMGISIGVRHTRGDEETGRMELLRSLPVGRLANLASLFLILTITYALLALVLGFSLYALGIESIHLEGSLLYGAVLGVTGMLFAAIGALFAQLSPTARGSVGLSFGFLGFVYLLRAMGDLGNETLSLLSPLGLVLRSEVYVSNVWWPVLIVLGLAVVTSLGALALHAGRDLGAGLLPTRPGRRHAGALLSSPFGLAFRLQRTTLIAWAVGMFVLGASYGSVFGDIEAFFDSSEIMQQLLPMVEGFSPAEQFIVVLVAVNAMFGSIPAIQMMLRVWSEERAGRIEPILARAVSRNRLIGSHLALAVLAAMGGQLLAAIGLWSASSAVMDEPMPLGMILGATLSHLPAILVMVGLAAALVGRWPEQSRRVWLYLGYSFFVVYLGNLLQLPGWMERITPFGYVPQLPIEEPNGFVWLLTLAIATLLATWGVTGYRERDIKG